MFYLLLLLLILVIFYAINHVVSALFKGCLVAVSVFLIGLLVFLFVKSTKVPVNLLDIYIIDNFEIHKVEK